MKVSHTPHCPVVSRGACYWLGGHSVLWPAGWWDLQPGWSVGPPWCVVAGHMHSPDPPPLTPMLEKGRWRRQGSL